MRLTFKELKDQIAKVVPKDIPYTVELEAGNIAIVTPVPNKFGGGEGLIGKIAKRVKRKIVLRPDVSIMKTEAEAKKLIQEIVPEEADITNIYFDSCYREIIIQCQKPGEAVGDVVQISTPFETKPVGSSRLSEPHLSSPRRSTTSVDTVKSTPPSDESCSKISASTSTDQCAQARRGPA